VKNVVDKANSGNQETAQTKVGAFENLLKDAFEEVNSLQNEATNMQTRFDGGDRSLSLSDVMLASQKSSISFEATLQVRNKLIEAYKTVSQMQI
ncbi:MAG TPA: flagellar hook-basal body complex protein FliE, partial [Succinivibrionaceae bacterium]|nr:flagellar hook-basal body complex protein FliE [Succinivibrionaceae bacterium]